MAVWSDWFNKLWDCLVMKEEDILEGSYNDYEMVEQAKKELEQARNLFTRVEDPDMVEYAVYNLKAAEKRFDYLIKRLKKPGNTG
ncbi:DUF2508 family protein [Syntrophomonas erecta]